MLVFDRDSTVVWQDRLVWNEACRCHECGRRLCVRTEKWNRDLDFPVKQTKHMLWGRSALCTAVNDLLNWMLEFIYCRLWPVTVACSWCLLFLYQASRVEMLIIGLWICQPASLIVSLSNHNCRHVEWRQSAHPKCHILLIWLKESHCWFFFHTVESLTQ